MRPQRISRKAAHVPGWNLSGNEPGASCDGDSGPQGAHNNPKPGNHPELTAHRAQPGAPALTSQP